MSGENRERMFEFINTMSQYEQDALLERLCGKRSIADELLAQAFRAETGIRLILYLSARAHERYAMAELDEEI